MDGTTLTLKHELEHLGAVTDCTYSPDNKLLVACDAHRKVVLYNVEEYKVSHVIPHTFLIFMSRNYNIVKGI